MNGFLFIVVVIANQYLFTVINDVFINQVISLQNTVYACPWYQLPLRCQKSINLFQIMVSRAPTLSTFMGVEASREFFSKFMLAVLLVTCCGYCILPILKFAYSGGNHYSDLSIFRIWSPLPQENLLTILPLYLLQVAAMFFDSFGYGVLAAYMMSVAVACSFQVRLVGVSCSTFRERVLLLLQKSGVRKDNADWQCIYCDSLLKEIADSARHYQHLWRNWKEMYRLLSKMVDVVFYSGMCCVIVFGVSAVTEQNKFRLINAFLVIMVVILNQYLFTVINDVFINQVISLQNTVYACPWYQLPLRCQKSINLFQIMVSRPPTLSTFMGVEASREFFSKTINATYFYISALLSWNRK